MWIRSQDKLHLHDVKTLDICKHTSCKDNQMAIIEQISYYSEDADLYEIMGIYDSKERCIEILDGIQRFLNSYNCKYSEKINSTYEMPSE